MKKLLLYILERYFNRKLDFRVRLFNVLAMAGIAISSLMAIGGIIVNVGPVNLVIGLLGTFLSVWLLYYSYRSGNYQLCYKITVVVIFMILFPLLFFTGGGYISGMPAFFIFGVLFTIFMLEGKSAIIMSAIELAVYITICLIALIYPNTVKWLVTKEEIAIDITIAFSLVSIVIGASMFIHFRMYNLQQRELEKAREDALAAKEILERQNEALEQLNNMKTEFLGNISHELKTPLTVVSGYAQLSERQLKTTGGSAGEPDNTDIINKMKFISSEAERLGLMVGQILDITRIEEGRMSITANPCHIDEIIHSTIKTYFPILNKNENKLEIQIDKNLPMIEADPIRISQVIINLIANAIRFTTAGTISVSAALSGSFVEINVRDTGTGIPHLLLPYIFERYRTQSSTDVRDTGTGLGLFICKYIIEEHGGEITAESKPGKGTVIRFTVPVVKNINDSIL